MAALWRGVQALAFGLLLICPVCHRGRMARSLFTMNERCPNCGVVFERDRGEMTGGMATNMVLTSIIGIAAAVYLAVFSGLNLAIVVALLVAIVVGFGLLFHRHARGLWIAVLYITGAIGER